MTNLKSSENSHGTRVIIFTDGSSRGNPGAGGWGAVISNGDKVIEIGGREKHTTNNRMELLGPINALSVLGSPVSNLEIIVNTDSSYVINGMKKWIYGWQKNDWKNSEKKEVANRDLWEQLIKVSNGKDIKWNYVGGHIGVEGNERCDVIATSNADNEKIDLYNGKASHYKYNLLDTKGSSVKIKSKSKNKEKAYSYLSLVNGVFNIDETWLECEKRVKGVKGNVKFKKSFSLEDEKKIIKEWTGKSK